MYIANPIFDTVFKRLMENERVARFFIETLIGMPVESITLCQQERTHINLDKKKAEITAKELDERDLLSVIRYDFVAVIRTQEGYKKVLIEIQKAKNFIDLMRFRNYLGEKYKQEDIITIDDKELEKPLPIITIYMLGFKLAETNAAAIRVSRNYFDMIDNVTLDVKSEFIECLTHDSYVVQIPRIEGKTRTRLEKLLSIFEQKYFIDDKGIRKEYKHEVDDENIRRMIDILYHTAADPEEQKKIENEWSGYELIENIFGKQKQEIALLGKELEEKDKALEENRKELEEMCELVKRLQNELDNKN